MRINDNFKTRFILHQPKDLTTPTHKNKSPTWSTKTNSDRYRSNPQLPMQATKCIETYTAPAPSLRTDSSAKRGKHES